METGGNNPRNAPPPALSTFTSPAHPSKSSWKVDELVYYEPFDDLSGWRSEGNLTATARDGCLLIECGSANEDRGNVWSLREFQSPMYFEFRFKKLSGRSGLNLIFWNARIIDGSEFFSVPRGWIMTDVTDGNMESYHVSYCRSNTDITNFHKNPNFHDLTHDVPDPLTDPGTDWHTIGVYQNGSHLMFYENGQVVHDVDEDQDFPNHTCHQRGAHKAWNLKNEWGTMCPGLDARKVYADAGDTRDLNGAGRPYTFEKPHPGRADTYTSGRIGFRHQNGITLYDDLRVWSLLSPRG